MSLPGTFAPFPAGRRQLLPDIGRTPGDVSDPFRNSARVSRQSAKGGHVHLLPLLPTATLQSFLVPALRASYAVLEVWPRVWYWSEVLRGLRRAARANLRELRHPTSADR